LEGVTSFINHENHKLNSRKLTNAFFGKLTSSNTWFHTQRTGSGPTYRANTIIGMRTLATNKKSILLVDDDKSILRTFSRILEKSGYEIDTAETGKEATDKALSRQYDLALVDIRLPDMDGTDLLAKLKKPLQHTVKIMITGFPSLETGVKALDEGADAYLVKPVKPQELLGLLEEKLKNREDSTELRH